MNPILIGVIMLGLGVVIGWGLSRLQARADRKVAGGLIDQARRESQAILREARVQAQEEATKNREQLERETKAGRQEMAEAEKRLLQRESQFERRLDALERKTAELNAKEQTLADHDKDLQKLRSKLDDLKRLSQQELQRVSSMTADEAKRMLLNQIRDETQQDANDLTRTILEEAKQRADDEARRVITIAIERLASSHVQSGTSCVLTLPSEEMKGRIIGREGRNIRAFEAATGINVLIDDTPQTVVLSGFDPVRRELARQTMERLVADGRINPARIEEEVAKVHEEIQRLIQQAGEEAVFHLGLRHVAPEVITLLGRLKFRHSYAQNVLDHSIEVARLEGLMATELGLSQELGRRVGLFHDIGKAVDHEMPGSHAIIGGDLLKKYGEPPVVYEAVACHHHETEAVTVYGMLTSAADAMSASRPGARSESMELYVSRLEKLEGIANTFAGVEKCYALQAGREIRVLVEPGQVSDGAAVQLARDIRKKIEQELQYPGQIKVTVVRETRAIEFAK